MTLRLSGLTIVFFVVGVSVHGAPPSRMAKLANEAEPSSIGNPDRIERYIRLFERAVVRDQRIFAFSVRAADRRENRNVELAPKTIRLSGHAEFPEHRELLRQFLECLGFEPEVTNIELLPSTNLGDLRFAILKVTHCISYDCPNAQSEALTECLLGEPLWLLKKAENEMYLCHSGDGYVGYVSGDALQRLDEQQFDRYLTGPRVRLLRDVRLTHEVNGPVGGQLKWVRREGSSVFAQLPSGRTVEIADKDSVVADKQPSSEVESIIHTAKQLTGTPYLWGGKTRSGIDCSGLMQVAFASQGFHLPRDSSQQIYVGKLTGTRWHRAEIQRGDALYFLGPGGNIAHTGIYLGNGEYLEAISSGVTITSLQKGASNYDGKRDATFAFAKRLIE